MEESRRKDFIKKLADGRENLNLLQNMLKKEASNVEYQLKLAAETRQYINDVLFELTGDNFYLNA